MSHVSAADAVEDCYRTFIQIACRELPPNLPEVESKPTGI